jgi:hypothetical protein
MRGRGGSAGWVVEKEHGGGRGGGGVERKDSGRSGFGERSSGEEGQVNGLRLRALCTRAVGDSPHANSNVRNTTLTTQGRGRVRVPEYRAGWTVSALAMMGMMVARPWMCRRNWMSMPCTQLQHYTPSCQHRLSVHHLANTVCPSIPEDVPQELHVDPRIFPCSAPAIILLPSPLSP